MHDLPAFARHTLQSLGLAAEPLAPADGWSNSVWLTPSHALRVSSGRFRDAYAHERRVLHLLPPDVPHAPVMAYGQIDEREWMVQRRATGVPLVRAWPDLDVEQRRRAIHQLGAALRALHTLALPNDLRNPWLDDALAPDGKPADAYHAPPHDYDILLRAAYDLPVADQGLLHEVGAFVRERVYAFDSDPAVLVHCDIHFANIMWDGDAISAILDWEGSRTSAPDQELGTLLRFVRTPAIYDNPRDLAALTSNDLRNVPRWLAEVYPELMAHPHLNTRLVVYEAMWQLVQVFHFPPGSGIYDPWANLRRLLDDQEGYAFPTH